MSSVISSTDATFASDVLGSEKPVLVDFWAAWCGPCKMMAPSLDALAAEQDQVAVVKVNVDDCPDLARTYDVKGLPTLAVFANGEIVKRMTGAKTKAALLNELKEFLG